jgi:hypothetical protein
MARRDGAGIRLLTRNGNVEPEGEISPEQDELGQPTGFRCSRARFVFTGADPRLKREMWMKKARKGTLRTGGVGF